MLGIQRQRGDPQGGTLGNMIDPMTNIRLRARCHGEILLRVENPETLIYQYFGMRKFQEHADIFDWFVNSFFNTVKSTIGKLAREQRRSVLDIMDMQDELAAACDRWDRVIESDLATNDAEHDAALRIIEIARRVCSTRKAVNV